MSDLVHALAVSIAGLVMTVLGLLMAWHCQRSVRRGELQISMGCLVERHRHPRAFRLALASFGLMALGLTLMGAYCFTAGLRLL